MNNQLINILGGKENKKVLTINSRDVAEMIDKRHDHLLRDIDKFSIVLNGNPQLGSENYFIESTFENRGKQYKCYELTKKGCDMVAHKITGEKGIIFTAQYINKFEEMKQYLTIQQDSYMIQDPITRAERWIEEQKEKQLLVAEVKELSPLAALARARLDTNGTVNVTAMTETYELKQGQITCWAKTNGYINKNPKIKLVNEQGREYFKTIEDDFGHKNIVIKEEGISLIDENIDEIRKSPCRYKNKNN